MLTISGQALYNVLAKSLSYTHTEILRVEGGCNGGFVDCPHPIKSVLPQFYPLQLPRTKLSMRIQRSEGLGSRLGGGEGGRARERQLTTRVDPTPWICRYAES